MTKFTVNFTSNLRNETVFIWLTGLKAPTNQLKMVCCKQVSYFMPLHGCSEPLPGPTISLCLF